MNKGNMKAISETIPNHAAFTAFISRLFDVTKPETVYGQPVTVGGQTIITVSESCIFMGAGYGSGSGRGSTEMKGGGDADGEGGHGIATMSMDGGVGGYVGGIGSGGGGGGGGLARARPVAVISVDDEGVSVSSVIDSTKIIIAFFAMFSALIMFLRRMRRDDKG